jgi:hypothetical protein
MRILGPLIKASVVAATVFAVAWIRIPRIAFSLETVIRLFVGFGILIIILSLVIGFPIAYVMEKYRMILFSVEQRRSRIHRQYSLLSSGRSRIDSVWCDRWRCVRSRILVLLLPRNAALDETRRTDLNIKPTQTLYHSHRHRESTTHMLTLRYFRAYGAICGHEDFNQWNSNF